jgi:serine/threonine protein kinase
MLSEKQYLNLDKNIEMIGNEEKDADSNDAKGNYEDANMEKGNYVKDVNANDANDANANDANANDANANDANANDENANDADANQGKGNDADANQGKGNDANANDADGIVKNVKNNKLKNNLLGQGSYGCVYYPGITCNGKINNKPYVTKLQEVTFYSVNEISIGKYIKTHVSKYKSFFAPIIKYCVVTFQTIQKSDLNINDCDILFSSHKKYYNENYNKKYDKQYEQPYQGYLKSASDNYKKELYDRLHTNYYLMYMNYIHNQTIKSFFKNFNNFDIYSVGLIKSYFIIVKSIGILISNKIIHNDLHVNNILINLKNNKPIIIDFGLGIFFDKCFEYKKQFINFEYLKNTLFDFRDDQYHVLLEKRFISFIIYNNSQYYNVNISENSKKNELTLSIIDMFIKDSYETIANQKVIPFNDVELAEYYKSLKQFYYQFLNKYKYPNYSVIVVYLLNFVLMYTDLYSVVFDIFYINYSLKLETKNSNSGSKLFFDFFLQLFKKNLHPNPLMRLQHSQINKIFTYIIRSIKKFNSVISYDVFIKELNDFLISQSINTKILFHKTFASIDFHTIFNKDVYYFVKQNF